MAKQGKNGILWCQYTFNIAEGCQKVAPECENCYAEDRDKRYHGGQHWGPNSSRKQMSDAYWREPLRWQQWAKNGVCHHCQGKGTIKIPVLIKGHSVNTVEARIESCLFCLGRGKVEPYHLRVFCSSLADVFEDHPDLKQPRQRLFSLIAETPDLDWLLLTKRPENILRLTYQAIDPFGHPELDECGEPNGLDVAPFDELFPNVWLGTTGGTQKTADKNIAALLEVPAVVRFLSVEPLLSTIRIGCYLGSDKINWVIAGGESGANARYTADFSYETLKKDCDLAAIPFFMKQMGTLWMKVQRSINSKGDDWDDLPEKLRCRKFPIVRGYDYNSPMQTSFAPSKLWMNVKVPAAGSAFHSSSCNCGNCPK